MERNIGLTYCGMSRAKSLKGLAFDGHLEKMPSLSRLTKYYSHKYFKEVKNEDARLDELAAATIEAFQVNQMMQQMQLEPILEEDEMDLSEN